MSRIRMPIAVGILVLIGAGPLFGDTAQLAPAKDNTLYEPIVQDAFADRSDGAGPTMFTGKVKDADADPGAGTRPALRRAVLEFDIAGSIPVGATIQSVQLTMYAEKVKLNTSFNVTLHRATSEWGEGTSNTGNSQQGRGEAPTPDDATWRHTLYPNSFWTAPGGDFLGTASATAGVGAVGSYTWGSTSGMVADVQLWLNDPAQNHGWVIKGDESRTETAKRFGTRENTTVTWRPRLVVVYTPATVSGGCCQGSACTIQTSANCAALGGTYQGDGTSCSPNPCYVPTGACCATSGTCSIQTETACTGAGGTFQGDDTTCATIECPVVLTPYLDPLPLPAVATPVSGAAGGTATYDMYMKEFEQQLHSQLPPTRVWGFASGMSAPSYPGPTIEAHHDQPVTVRWINDLRDLSTGLLRTTHYLPVDLDCVMGAENSAKTVVHMHGALVPEMFDGYPEATFLPGSEATYLYLNEQHAGSIWYHDHALGITRLNVNMGLAGLYLLRDDVEDALNIPRGEFEVPLVLQDRKFNPDGSLMYPAVSMDHVFGDKTLVNGKVWPYLDVKRGKYRFRLYNGSGSRVYRLSLVPPSGIMTFTVIGNEGGLLEAPVPGVGEITIGPGERYDTVLDFEPYAGGSEILVHNSAPAPFPNGAVTLPQVMKFRVGAQLGDTDPLPANLRPITRLQPSDAVVTRDLVLKSSGDACGKTKWLINNLGWSTITEYPQLDTVEIWRFINDSGVSHPMHLHLVQFQILDRDGFTKGPGGEIIPNGNPQLPPAEESGWRDTAMVGPNEILRVIARFERYKGRFAYHCHILDHEDHEMMRQFQTIRCGDAELDPTESCDDGAANGTPASCCSASCAPVTNGAACDDGDACTAGDTCLAAACVAGPPVGSPAEVQSVRFEGGSASLTWDPIPGAPAGTVHDVARGLVGEWPVGSGAGETCLGTLPAPPAPDAGVPGADQAYWYLVRGRNDCGTGSYGFAAAGGVPAAERITNVCP